MGAFHFEVALGFQPEEMINKRPCDFVDSGGSKSRSSFRIGKLHRIPGDLDPGISRGSQSGMNFHPIFNNTTS